jgi:6-pyruvoyltetrahydropterin/6-carboxytetrahydropterin synthase
MTVATIAKDFEFAASHRLEGLPADHPCSRLHGHNYVVRVTITGEVVEPGFVIDYRRLSAVKDILDRQFDHRHLNDVLPGVNPTAENLAAHFLEWAAHALVQYDNVQHIAVSVSETPKTWATVALNLDLLS